MGSSSNHVEYPDPNVSNFVSIKLSASNYELWKTQMRCFIDNAGLLGFIDGTTPPPPSSSSNGTTNDEYRQWRRLDQRLKGWILGSLSEEVLAIVVDFDTASDVWTELQHSFGPYLQPLVQMEAVEDIDFCRDMYKAAVTGDLDFAETLLRDRPNLIKARIASGSQTALHVAVGTKKNHFVKKFVGYMTTDQLELQTTEGNTALSVAAMVDNFEAAEWLVFKHPSLLYTENCNHSLPMHLAAKYAHEKTLWYLLTATEDHLASDLHYNPFEGQSGVQLLVDVIISGFFGIAVYLVQRYPRLAILKTEKGDSPLAAIARKPSAFRSGIKYDFWKKIIYYFWFPREGSVSALRDQLAKGRGIIDNIEGKKWVYVQALELVKRLCTEIQKSTDRDSYRWKKAILLAASLGIHEVVEEIVETFFNEIWSNNEDRNCIILLAVKYRCKKVFNLIEKMGHRYAFSVARDTWGNNILHIAAKLAPSHTLNLLSGAALQMQSELQWFQANSCTIVAALIATVAFAAAITVPGGNNGNNGLPIFSKSGPFGLFLWSNAASLFSSLTCLIAFLTIATSRCAERDFLLVLPYKLLIGLFTLFASIFFTVVSFSSILILVSGRSNASLQFLLLYAVITLLALIGWQWPLIEEVFDKFGIVLRLVQLRK